MESYKNRNRIVAKLPAIGTAAPRKVPQGDTDAPEQSISIGSRLRSWQTVVSILIALAVLFFVFQQLNVGLGDVWREVRQANPVYLGLAFIAYYATFPIRAARWTMLLTNARMGRDDGYDLPLVKGMTEIYVLSWFVNCVVPAKLGDAYRSYLLKKNAGPPMTRSLGTIFAERIIDVVTLAILLIMSVLFIFHGAVPESLRWWMAVGAVLASLGIGGLLVLMTMNHRIGTIVPSRFRSRYTLFSDGIVASFSRDRWPIVVILTVSVWLLEAARVYFVAQALGVDLSLTSSVFVALLASLLTTFPFTPAGLGVVEGGTILAFKLFNIGAANATAVAFVDRGVAIYSVVLVGGLLYFLSKHS